MAPHYHAWLRSGRIFTMVARPFADRTTAHRWATKERTDKAGPSGTRLRALPAHPTEQAPPATLGDRGAPGRRGRRCRAGSRARRTRRGPRRRAPAMTPGTKKRRQQPNQPPAPPLKENPRQEYYGAARPCNARRRATLGVAPPAPPAVAMAGHRTATAAFPGPRPSPTLRRASEAQGDWPWQRVGRARRLSCTHPPTHRRDARRGRICTYQTGPEQYLLAHFDRPQRYAGTMRSLTSRARSPPGSCYPLAPRCIRRRGPARRSAAFNLCFASLSDGKSGYRRLRRFASLSGWSSCAYPCAGMGATR